MDTTKSVSHVDWTKYRKVEIICDHCGKSGYVGDMGAPHILGYVDQTTTPILCGHDEGVIGRWVAVVLL